MKPLIVPLALVALLAACGQPVPAPACRPADPPQLSEIETLRALPIEERIETLRSRRERHIEHLYEYVEARVFPENSYVEGRTPVFRDAKGTTCAVAYLMLRSGAGDLVDSIARSRNFIRVMEIQEGPALDWILSSGLTQEECALIQPTYEWREEEPVRRIRKHLFDVARKLRLQSEESLALCAERLAPKP